MPDSVDIILMASGSSRRFGKKNKLLQLFQGKTLLRRALELACSLPLNGKTMLAYAEPEIGEAARGFPVLALRNERPERGLCESVRLGTAASSAEHCLFMPCDQPFLDAATVGAVVSRRAPGRIVVPVHAGEPGNPVLFSAFFREELLALPDGDSPRLLKERHADRVVSVNIEDPLPLRDMDTEEDLRLLEALAAREDRSN